MSRKYFSNKYSKIFALNLVSDALNESQKNNNKNNKLMIHTANGIYIGTLKEQVDYDNLDIQGNDDFFTVYRKMYLRNLESYENSDEFSETEKVSENPISIILEDVEVITSGKTINLPFVEIFIDQIIGFALGSTS